MDRNAEDGVNDCIMKEILLLLVMFWNLENFFDPFAGNSSAGRYTYTVQDEPYTPTGEKFWTWKKFAQKRDNIARTICLVAEENGVFPSIIGLCEVENRLVLNQLTQNTPLAKLNYGIIHKDGPDRRGIDAALLYRKELFTPLRVRFIPTLVPGNTQSGQTQSGQTVPVKQALPVQEALLGQDVLPAQDAVPVIDTLLSRETVYVKGVFMGLDTLHCFVVHWPSKLGGKESLRNRMAASDCLKEIADSILCADRRANVIVMGDFNDSQKSEPVANLGNLVNMSLMELGVEEGCQKRYTYKYKGEWSRIDHFLVSPWMYEGEGGSRNEGDGLGNAGRLGDACRLGAAGGAERQQLSWLFCDDRSSGVFAHRFLLEVDQEYLGYKIRRTMVGPKYNGGVSDHLPIILRVWGYEY